MFRQPGYLIRRLHQRSTAAFAAIADGLDITQIQFSILLVLKDLPGSDATRISELIGSDRTTIRQALLVLEKKRLIRRATGVHDRRRKSLEITPVGVSIADRMADLAPGLGTTVLQGLDAAEQELFMQLLTKAVSGQEDDEVCERGPKGLVEHG